MARNDWKLQVMAGHGKKWLQMAANIWECLYVGHKNGWKWLKIAEHCWKW